MLNQSPEEYIITIFNIQNNIMKMIVNLSKQASVVCLGKTGQNHTPMVRQKSSKNILGVLTHNSSECSSRNASECGLRIQSECSSKILDNNGMKKKASSRGR
jgi:hypothetical protein